MKILKIHLKSLRNAEYIQYGLDILNINNTHNPALLMIAAQHIAFASKLQQLEAAFKQASSSTLTPIIDELDQLRGQYLVGIRNNVESLQYHYDASKREAAIRLQHYFDTFGSASTIGRQSLQGETATINNIVKDLNADPDLAAAAALLDISGWIEELRNVNNTLNDHYMARTQELAAANPDKLKLLRQEANELYYKMRDTLSAYSTINGHIEPWSPAINAWNALTRQYNDLLATRTGRVTSRREEEEREEE